MVRSERYISWQGSATFDRHVRSFVLLLLWAPALAACHKKEDPQLAGLRKQVETQENELAELRAKYLDSVRNGAFYKGSLDALRPRLDDELKTSIAMCRRDTDAGATAALIQLRAACDATNENIRKVLSTPAPVPVPVPGPGPGPVRDPKPIADQQPAELPVPPPAADGTKPLTPSDPPPSGEGVADQQSMEKTVLLAGAFLACEYYTAGTCSAVVAAVGLKLGLDEGQVKAESGKAYQTLQAKVDQSGIALPSPTGGEPIILRSGEDEQVTTANRAFNALPQADRVDPCKAIEPYRNVELIKPFIEELSKPLSFKSSDQKINAVSAARTIDLGFASLLERVPVGSKGLPCE